MRNAVELGDGFILTTDNSGGIGEKEEDLVHVPDTVTAYFAARVALLEQWAADAKPTAICIHNFSGDGSWDKYVTGVTQVFQEAQLETPPITGSTETNIPLKQSAMAVTMIGKKQYALKKAGNCTWFVYGKPLVGHEVMDEAMAIASLHKLRIALQNGIVQKLWPVGSKGIEEEIRQIFQDASIQVTSDVNCQKSAGPATAILIAIPKSSIEQAKAHFENGLFELTLNTTS